MKYMDWINVHPFAYGHYAEGDQFDRWMVDAFNECVDNEWPVPQEVSNWWWDKNDASQKRGEGFWVWRERLGVRNWHIQDWNDDRAGLRWNKKDQSSTLTPDTGGGTVKVNITDGFVSIVERLSPEHPSVSNTLPSGTFVQVSLKQ
jgi:hypothetical protein